MMAAQPTYSFSLAGYLLSVAAGCAVVASALAIAFGYGGFAIPVFAFFGVMGGLVPAMLLFLPVVLLGIWLGNRFRLRSWGYAIAFGAAGAALYYPLAIAVGVVSGSTMGVSPWPACILAVAGAVAGYVYFVTERIDREGRRKPSRRAVPPPDERP